MESGSAVHCWPKPSTVTQPGPKTCFRETNTTRYAYRHSVRVNFGKQDTNAFQILPKVVTFGDNSHYAAMQSHTVISGYTETENRVTDLKNVFFVKN